MTDTNVTNSIITTKFKVRNATNFVNSINDSSTYMYLFAGRSYPWNADDIPTPVENTAKQVDYDPYRSMMFLKRIGSADVRFCIPRHDWTSGNIYSQYTQFGDLPTILDNGLYPYYVLSYYNLEYNVYKCISNNRGLPSTEQPIGKSTTSVIRMSDGYVWKYMYTLSSSEVSNYLTTTYIPVKTLTSDDGSEQWDVQQNAVDGSIDHIIRGNPGRGFQHHFGYVGGATAIPSNTTVIVLDHTAHYNITNPNSIPLTNGQNNAYLDYTIYLSSGTGAGQHKKISSYQSYIPNTNFAKVTLESALTTAPEACTYYEIAPTVVVSGDGSNCEAVCTINNTNDTNTINEIIVLSEGSGYTSSVNTISNTSYISFEANTNVSILSATSATLVIPPKGGHGSNPVEELCGFNIMVKSDLSGEEWGTDPNTAFTITNDFRQFGLLENPYQFGTNTAFTDSYGLQTTNLYLSGVTGTFVHDEIVVGQTSGAAGYIVDYNEYSEGVIRLSGVEGTFVSGEVILQTLGPASGTIDSINNPDIEPFSGDVVMFANINEQTRSSTQIEVFHNIFTF